MKREILFRGKRVDNGEWIYGNLYQCEEDSEGYVRNLITPKNRNGNPYMVDDKTVGQYTGLIDKNGVRIYEGDIVNCKTMLSDFEGYIIRWNGFRARYVIEKHGKDFSMTDGFEYKIIGNIFDNPELIESRR